MPGLRGHLPRGRLRPAQAERHQGEDPLLRLLHGDGPLHHRGRRRGQVQGGRLRNHHRGHLGPPPPGGRALRGDGADRRGHQARRHRLRDGLVHRPGSARPGQGLQGEGARRVVHHHQAGRPRQGRRRALGGGRHAGAHHPHRHWRAHRRLRGLRGAGLRLAPPGQGQHRRPHGADERSGRGPRGRGDDEATRLGAVDAQGHARAVPSGDEDGAAEQHHELLPGHAGARLPRVVAAHQAVDDHHGLHVGERTGRAQAHERLARPPHLPRLRLLPQRGARTPRPVQDDAAHHAEDHEEEQEDGRQGGRHALHGLQHGRADDVKDEPPNAAAPGRGPGPRGDDEGDGGGGEKDGQMNHAPPSCAADYSVRCGPGAGHGQLGMPALSPAPGLAAPARPVGRACHS
mmetsp:Transcript_11481/g.34039  ORF Transcript_11481/g.34039 Transcript_11481/m.34039 type:complete len:402 (+) Transcript_11481:463-1668(+)